MNLPPIVITFADADPPDGYTLTATLHDGTTEFKWNLAGSARLDTAYPEQLVAYREILASAVVREWARSQPAKRDLTAWQWPPDDPAPAEPADSARRLAATSTDPGPALATDDAVGLLHLNGRPG